MNLNVLEQPLAPVIEGQLPGSIRARRTLSKGKRLAAVCNVMATLRPRFDSEALWLLNVLFKLVEDRCSGSPFRGDGSNHHTRMYGPSRVQLRKKSSLGSDSWEFWAKLHTVWIGLNGAVRIALRYRHDVTLLDIPGADGVSLPEGVSLKKEG